MLSKEELVEILKNDVNEFNNLESEDGFDMSELDFSSINLNGAVFKNVDLTSSSFADSQLTEVKFLECDLTSVDFTRANLTECVFNDSILNGADFSYAVVNYCNFTDADLAGTILMEADLTDSDLSMSENLSACRFDDTTVWPETENLPEEFDSTYSDDLSSLKDEDDYMQSDY